MKIGITGIDGLIGWHTRCRLHAQDDVEVLGANRKVFSEPARLQSFVKDCDAIVHLAGVNRASDEEIATTNPALAQSLVTAITASGTNPHVLYASSTHADGDSIYGNSKKAAGEIFENWAESVGGRFTNVILPHVFGERGRPFYNSVVSTFCHQIANEETPQIDVDGMLNLLHAQDVAEVFYNSITNRQYGTLRPEGRSIRVSELLMTLNDLSSKYMSGTVPDLNDSFSRDLFNTFRGYLYPHFYPFPLTLNTDNRGSLVEAVKTHNGGQVFFSTSHPGITRGNHFHLRKVERFLVLSGEATISIRRLFDGEARDFEVSGESPVVIDIPTLHTHNITNTGSQELVTLFWSNEIFDPEAPDTYAEPVDL